MGQDNIEILMAMVNDFSGYKVDPSYFSFMFKSPLIIEWLNDIYYLQQDQKLNLEDTLKIRQVFQANFSLLAESYHQGSTPYSAENLTLSLVFFNLLLCAGIGCACFPIIFLPLVLIFFSAWVIYSCLTNIPTYSLERGDVERYQAKLSILENNLSQLRNLLVDKYPIKSVNNFFKHSGETFVDQERAKKMVKKKKTVSFSPILCEFFGETTEMRLPINAYGSRLCRASAEV